MGIKIAIETRIEGTIEPAELGRYLIAHVAEHLEISDDAGCDWLTDSDGNIYIDGSDWQVSWKDPNAALIDAANVLIYGGPIKLEERQNVDV